MNNPDNIDDIEKNEELDEYCMAKNDNELKLILLLFIILIICSLIFLIIGIIAYIFD